MKVFLNLSPKRLVEFAGVNRFYENLTTMLGFRINNYMKYSWTVITPVFTIVSSAISLEIL